MKFEEYDNIFLVDISWQMYRSYYTFSTMRSPLQKPIGHLFRND